jgi:hypothetical protein
VNIREQPAGGQQKTTEPVIWLGGSNVVNRESLIVNRLKKGFEDSGFLKEKDLRI